MSRASKERISTIAGYTFNGFGFDKKLSPMIELGEHHCKYCHSRKTFVLAAEQYIAKVLWVISAGMFSKYAVVCSECENGYYVNDRQRDSLLYLGAKIQVDDDGISIIQPNGDVIPEDRAQKQNIPAKKVCPKCGTEYSEGENFCGICGERLK